MAVLGYPDQLVQVEAVAAVTRQDPEPHPDKSVAGGGRRV
jgi:hypothetical protein